MSKIEIGRWAELLKRITGIAGARTVSGDLSPEVSPTMLLEDLSAADFLFLKSVRLCGGGSSITGGVGFTAKWRLRNPTDSGVVALVSCMEVSPVNTILSVRGSLNEQIVNFPTTVIARVADSRWGVTGAVNQTALVLSSSIVQATGPAGENFWVTRTPSNTPVRHDFNFPLLPGSCVDWGTDGLNLSVRSWVRWSERGLPDLER